MTHIATNHDRQEYEAYHLTWEGIDITIRWYPDWLNLSNIALQTGHLEIRAADKVPLSITETGYKSHFIHPEQLEAQGGPVVFVTAWLDHEAASVQWQSYLESKRQPSLFSMLEQ